FNAVTVGLMLMVFVIGNSENGAQRWISIAGVSFQPSELAKFTAIILISKYLTRYGDKEITFKNGTWQCFLITIFISILIIMEKHISATLIVVAICSIIMIIGGVKLRWFVLLGTVGGAGLATLLLLSGKFGYAYTRIIGWLDPFNPPEGIDTYQTVQSIYAIGSGGIFGEGIGNSRQKFLYLPETENDFIFSIFCEEMGLIGALIVIALFIWLVFRGVSVSLNAKDRYGTLVGIGISLQIGIQAALNICVVTNAIPNTGISLPFFSHGGTSIMVLLAEMGVLLSISRSNYRVAQEKHNNMTAQAETDKETEEE
ncbi:MAG: FtsW/RodA/SpoVE family cell cycle protein, partial [Clostridia bacterium]|nr:FtsW/RodA/SpoVE family cell cycle protein [Clostridia bacterium]